MLRRSWSLLVAASNDQPDLVPLDLWQRTAMRTAAAPFLSWVAPTADASERDAFLAALKAQIQPPRRPFANRRIGTEGAVSDEMRAATPRDPGQLSIELDIPRAAVEWLARQG
jgi:hypothetical protein